MKCSKAILAAWTLASLSLFASACTTDQNHPLPEKFCGIKVPDEALAPLIPPGEKVTEDRDAIEDIAKHDWPDNKYLCRAYTEGSLPYSVMLVGADRVDGTANLNRNLEKPSPSRSDYFDGPIRIGRDGANAHVRCGVNRPEDIILLLRVNPPQDANAKIVKHALKELLDSYVPGVKDVLNCTK